MNEKEKDYNFIFHSTDKFKNYLLSLLNKKNISNAQVISDDKIKNEILNKSVFAVVKSGTVSLEVCKLEIFIFSFIKYLFSSVAWKTKR